MISLVSFRPDDVAFFSSGRTLRCFCQPEGDHCVRAWMVGLLWRVCRVDDYGFFGGIVRDEVCIVVGRANP